MAKRTPKGFDPSLIDTCIDDVKALSAPVQKAVTDFLQLITGKSGAMQAAKPVKCGPDGECDTGACLECAVHYQASALAVTLQALDAHCSSSEAEGA